MASKFYFGNTSATPSIVERVEVPKVPVGTVPYVVIENVLTRATNTGINLTGVNYINGNEFYAKAYCYDHNLTGPALINAKSTIFESYNYSGSDAIFRETFGSCSHVSTTGFNNAVNLVGIDTFRSSFWGCVNLVNTELSNVEKIEGWYTCMDMFRLCSKLPDSQLTNVISISGDYVAADMFWNCTNLTNPRLENLQSISSQYACMDMFANTGVTSVNLHSLSEINGYEACSEMFCFCPNLTSVNLTNLTNICGTCACKRMFYNCTNLTSVNFSNSISIDGLIACESMFGNCTNLTTIDLSGLSYVNRNTTSGTVYGVMSNMFIGSGLQNVKLNLTSEFVSSQYWADYLFKGAENLTYIDYSNQTDCRLSGDDIFKDCTNLPRTYFDNFTSISTYLKGCFDGCTNLTDAGMQNIVSITGRFDNSFCGCTNLHSVDFKKLEEISNSGSLRNTFCYSGVSVIKFPRLSTLSSQYIFDNMLTGVDSCTVYFPPALESVIGSWNSVTTGFGGTNTQVFFTAGVELPINIPAGYRVWIGKTEITNEATWNFAEGDSQIVTLYEGAIPKLGTFTFEVVEGETTEFTFDPADISYETIDISWTQSINVTSLRAIYYITDADTINIDLNYANNPTQIQITSGLSVTLTGEASNGYLEGGPYVVEAGIVSSIYLDFHLATINHMSASEIKTELENTFNYVGTPGFELLEENIGGIDYVRIHSLGTHRPVNSGIGYVYFNGADLVQQGYSHLVISGKGYASSENNWDFGYVSAGDHQSPPPSQVNDIKNKTYYDDNYLYLSQSGTSNIPTDFTIDYYPTNDNDLYINIGFLEDYSTSSGTDSLYVSGLTIMYS